jgi:hypothetical protein
MKDFELRIVGRTYQVKFLPSYSVSYDRDNEGFHSACDNTIRVATLDSAGRVMCDDELTHTLYHEIFEALKYVFQIELSQEDINRLSEGWLQVSKQLTPKQTSA